VSSTSVSRESTRFGRARKIARSSNSEPGERTSRAVLAREHAAQHVEAEFVEAVLLASGGAPTARAAEDRADAREELARMEGLREVVVRAHLEPDDAVHVLAARGKHEHGDAALRAQLAAEREPVDARQHEVEHDEVHRALLDRAHELAPVGQHRARKPFLLQVLRDERAESRVVVDDQDVLQHGAAMFAEAGATNPANCKQ
jgi:hypothetical protein